jgi:hypothetical protein
MFNLFPNLLAFDSMKEFLKDQQSNFSWNYYPPANKEDVLKGEEQQPQQEKLTKAQKDIKLKLAARVAKGETYADIALELAEELAKKDRKIKTLNNKITNLKSN